jgi:hypothetical protein
VLVAQLGVDARDAIGLARARVDALDQLRELAVPPLALRRPTPPPGVEAGARHAEHLAQPGD